MTDLKTRLQQQAKETSAVDTTDLREESKAREVKVWPEGIYRGRVIEVIEYGIQPQSYEGKSKAPAEEVEFRVMLFPSQRIKKELGENTSPIYLRSWPIALYNTPNSKSKKVFDLMNVTGDAKHFREFIGEAFRFKVVHKTTAKGKINALDLLGTLPAVDEETGKLLSVPEAPEDKLVLFTFIKPMKEMWDKLHIEGSKQDGTSKNFIQEKIMRALNFKGSDVEAMLKGAASGVDTTAPIIPDAVADTSFEAFDELPEPPTDDDAY